MVLDAERCCSALMRSSSQYWAATQQYRKVFGRHVVKARWQAEMRAVDSGRVWCSVNCHAVLL